jgi:hypothetical protein
VKKVDELCCAWHRMWWPSPHVPRSTELTAHVPHTRTDCHLAQVLGRGLALLPRDQIVVATKVGRYGSDTFDFRCGYGWLQFDVH